MGIVVTAYAHLFTDQAFKAARRAEKAEAARIKREAAEKNQALADSYRKPKAPDPGGNTRA